MNLKTGFRINSERLSQYKYVRMDTKVLYEVSLRAPMTLRNYNRALAFGKTHVRAFLEIIRLTLTCMVISSFL